MLQSNEVGTQKISVLVVVKSMVLNGLIFSESTLFNFFPGRHKSINQGGKEG